MTMHYESLFIGGQWAGPSTSAKITVVSPNSEEVIGSVPEAQEADVDAAVGAARRAFDDPAGWSAWDPADRGAAMERLADALEQRGEEMARRVSSQNGMPLSTARQIEGAFPVLLLRHFAALAKSVELEESRPHVVGGQTTVRREPLGVVAAIAPWNFPQTLAAFKYAAALAAGCTMVFKPSPETVLDSWLFAEAVEEAGIPAGVVNIVPGGPVTGAYLVAHPGVDRVSFTGSTAAGRQVAEACGRLLRPVSLELGGKSAAIVLDDVVLDPAEIAAPLVGATMTNNGQTCYLGTRILAPRRRYDEVVEFLAALFGSLKVGDALEEDTMIGPMVTARHRQRVEGYIAKGLGEGARIVLGGGRPQQLERGWFVEPTIFADVENDHTIAQEEIFGPVLSVIAYDDDHDAVRLANDSDFGLGGSVWTSDPDRGRDVARRVRTGTIGVNTYVPDPGSPFGGVKSSGIGRELGPDAIRDYQETKSIFS